MILSIEKLRYLWRNRASVYNANRISTDHFERLCRIIEQWEFQREDILNLQLPNAPDAEDIPTDDFSRVKENMREIYRGNASLTRYLDQINQVDNLDQVDQVAYVLHIKGTPKDPQLRISSNAQATSNHETLSTSWSPQNPESHYASFNYPFEIIQYFLTVRDNTGNLRALRNCADEKFVRKYMWMLANRKDTVPIISLASFYALLPHFAKIADNIDLDSNGYWWSLHFRDFVDIWQQISDNFTQQVTDSTYSELNDEDKNEFAKLTFISSIVSTNTKNALDMLQTGNQAIILYGPPGTGKTYTAENVINQLLGGLDKEALEACSFDEIYTKDSDLKTEIAYPGCWKLVQFHPAYTYYDFIGGIAPKLADGDELGYTLKEGIFIRFCAAARANGEKPFILLIDEINRADLSSVFGELLYALEYRNKYVSIPLFDRFKVPHNVYIIGTMNGTDKSLVTFDLALRRRFLFFPLKPDMSTLSAWNAEKAAPIDNDDLKSLIFRAEQLNKAIVGKGDLELGLADDFQIGQAYFMKIYDFCSAEPALPTGERPRRIKEFQRERLWDYHLRPLLDEYLSAEAESKQGALEAMRKKFVNA